MLEIESSKRIEGGRGYAHDETEEFDEAHGQARDKRRDKEGLGR